MANRFFDTSALVERYRREPGTDRVDELVEDPEASVIVSSLAVIETVSAFRRKYNLGEVTDVQLTGLVGEFFREALDNFVVLRLEESLFRFSLDLIIDDDLRTLDGLLLSTGLAVAEEVDDVTFITADDSPARIAHERGLEVEVPGSR